RVNVGLTETSTSITGKVRPPQPIHRSQPLLLTGHTDGVNAVALTPDGHTALTGSSDNTAIVWDLTDPDNPRKRATLTGHTGWVYSVTLTPDGHTALTGSQDRTAILWDLTNPARPVRRATLTGHTDSIRTVALTPDGRPTPH
ncbi:WD domain, G-beta repeat-containing protein, partial [Frankia sp. CpI1-P]